MSLSIAVAILNYNGRHWLEQFLPGVLAHSAGYAVYVIDNGSTDDSVAWMEAHAPEAKVIPLSTNYGYAGGYNEGLKQVPADVYILLNSDVEVTPNWIQPLQKTLADNPDMAACQPKLLDYYQRTKFEYAGAAGGQLDTLAYPWCHGRVFDAVEEDLGQYNEPRDIFWATGACMVVRATAFQEAGGFDALFFAHMEEIDLCWRLHHLGYRVGYVPESVVYHVGGGTLTKENPRKTFLNFRNGLLMMHKNMRGWGAFSRIFFRLCLDGISGIRFLFQGSVGNCLAVLRAHFAFYGVLLFQRKALLYPKKKSHGLHMYPQSVVWEYFVLGKKKIE